METLGLIWFLYCNLPLDIFGDAVFRSRFPSLLMVKKRTFLSFLRLTNQQVLITSKEAVYHLDLGTDESRNYQLKTCSCLETIKRFSTKLVNSCGNASNLICNNIKHSKQSLVKGLIHLVCFIENQ